MFGQCLRNKNPSQPKTMNTDYGIHIFACLLSIAMKCMCVFGCVGCVKSCLSLPLERRAYKNAAQHLLCEMGCNYSYMKIRAT